MKNTLLGALIAFLLGVLIWLVLFFDPAANKEAGVGQFPQGGDFTLQAAGGPVSLQDFRGKVVALYFGYTWCPDICPTSLGLLTMAVNELTPEELAQLQVLFISVDPDRDTPERLKTYVEYFHQQMIGATGSKAQIDKVVDQYGGAYRIVKETDSAMDYIVDHSSALYLVDQQGKLVKTLAHGTAAEVVLQELRALIHQ